MARTYSIYETKAKLSEILRQVKAGNEVFVSERGHTIAKILPFHPVEGLDSRLDELTAGGQIIKAPAGEKTFAVLKKKSGALARFLEERDTP